jgi:uncharacterized membrane protein YqaE (UPF0057 family)
MNNFPGKAFPPVTLQKGAIKSQFVKNILLCHVGI